jgi:hypothetical protein
MKSGLFPRDVRVIFPRVPLSRLAGGLILLSGGLSAMPASAQTTISTPQTPTFTATNSGTPYTILNGATFDGGGTGVDGFDADGSSGAVSVTVNGGDFSGNGGDGLNANANTTVTVNADTNGDPDATFTNNVLNGLETAAMATVTAGSFNENGNDGLYAGNGSTVEVNTDADGDSATFDNNGNNGLEAEGATVTITDGTFNDNGGGLRTDGNGDGLFARNSSITISPDVNSGHTPSFDGNNFGLSAGGSSVGITGGDYSYNDFDGALVFAPSGSVTISADPSTGDIGTFNSNGASGLQVSEGATATITAGTFKNNGNAGVLADHGAIVTVESDPSGDTPTFDDNNVAGLQSDGSTVNITAGDFSDNTYGGDGVYAFDGSTLNINTDSALYNSGSTSDYATFNDNSGSGVDVDASKATITDGLFSGNSLWGVLAEDKSTLTIEADSASGDSATFTGNGLGMNTGGNMYDGVKVDASTATITAGNFYANGDNGLYVADSSTVNINSDSNFGDYAVFQNNGTNGVEAVDSTVNITDGVFGGFAATPSSGGNVENGFAAQDGSIVTISEDPTSDDTPIFDGNGASGLFAGVSGDSVPPQNVTQVTVTAGDFSYNADDGLDAGANSNVTVEGGVVNIGGTPTATVATFTNNTNGLEAEGPASGFPGAILNITAASINNNTNDGVLGGSGSTINLNSDLNSTPSYIGDYNNYDGVYTDGTANITDGDYYSNTNDGVYGSGSSSIINIGSDVNSDLHPLFADNVNGLETAGTANITSGVFAANANGVLADSGAIVNITPDTVANNEPIFGTDGFQSSNTNDGLLANGATVNITDGGFFGNGNDGIQGDSASTINANLGNYNGLNYFASFNNNAANGLETAGTANITAANFNANGNDGALGNSSSTINVNTSTYISSFSGNTNGLETSGTANVNTGQFNTNTNDGLLADAGSTVNVHSSSFDPEFNSNGNNGLEVDGSAATATITAGDFSRNGTSGVTGPVSNSDGVFVGQGATANVNTDEGTTPGDFATFDNNVRDGIEVYGTATVTDGQFESNANNGIAAGLGGSVTIGQDANSGDTPSFTDNAGSGGGDYGGTFNINGGSFDTNADSGLFVGAFTDANNVVTGGQATISGGDFSGNNTDGMRADSTSTATISGGTFNGLPSGGSGTAQQNGVETAGHATISGGTFNGNSNDGVKAGAGSNVTVNDPPVSIPTFDLNANDGFETAGSATINAGDFSDNMIDGLAADLGANVTVNGGTFDTDIIDGLLATGSTTDVYLYGGSFLSNGTDLSAINDSTIYVYGTDLAFSLTPALAPAGLLDPNAPPFPSGYITGYLANNPNTLVSLSYNVGSGGNIVLQGNANPTVPEPSPLMLAVLPLGGLLVLRARRSRAHGA